MCACRFAPAGTEIDGKDDPAIFTEYVAMIDSRFSKASV